MAPLRPDAGEARSAPAPTAAGGTLLQRLDRAGEAGFGALARLRRARALHPRGVTVRARATVDPSSGLAAREALDAVVRLSRGAGLPEPLPDVHGVAVRLIDAHGPGRHQDLLLSGSFSPPVLRHLLRPAVRLDRAVATTVLPYRRPAGGRVLFRCDPVPVTSLAEVAAGLPSSTTLHAATPLGRWRPVATVELLEVLADDLAVRFDPWNTSAALVPAGRLNALRAAAYAGSRRGSGGSGDAGPAGQRDAP